MIGAGSTQVRSETRPLSSLAGADREDGIIVIGLGIADALAVMTAIHPGPYYWGGVIFAVVLFTVGYVALADRNQKWLSRAIEGAVAAPENAARRHHQGLAERAFLIVAAYGAANAFLALLWVVWGSGSPPVGLVPGMMMAQGVTLLVRAERVRSWEREANSELLVSFGWRRRHNRGYFVRSH